MSFHQYEFYLMQYREQRMQLRLDNITGVFVIRFSYRLNVVECDDVDFLGVGYRYPNAEFRSALPYHVGEVS